MKAFLIFFSIVLVHSDAYAMFDMPGGINLFENAPNSKLFDSRNALEDCRAQIPSRIFTEKMESITDPRIISQFFEAYDLLPAPMKHIFCITNQFLVDSTITTTADATMRIRKGIIVNELKLPQWINWKEQLNFGVNNDERYLNDSNAVRIELDSAVQNTSALYFIMLHELSHNIGSISDAEDAKWDSINNIENNRRFKRKWDVCFYHCAADPTKIIPAEKSPSFYSDLFNATNFLSAYASTNAEEDFAESMMLYIFTKVQGRTVLMRLPNGSIYDVGKKLNSPIFAEKLKFLENVYNTIDSRKNGSWLRR